MLSWQVGAVKVTRVVEMEIPIPPETPIFTQATPAALRAIPWLYPNFINAQDEMLLSMHALLVEAPGLRLVVDTCVGNDKPRAGMTGPNGLSTNFLEKVTEAGWTRESVDVVICTHMHVDHVGWNTMLQDGKWVPTFPNARYLFGKTEFAHWSAEGDAEQQAILADSVQPILDAGLAEFVDMDYRVSPEVYLVRVQLDRKSSKPDT